MISIFISLLLAHFAGDYPLQPDWLVQAKIRWRGLSLHILIHLFAMLGIFGLAALQAWPAILAVAFAHFWIDFVKVRLNLARPAWVIAPYIVDQSLHYLTLWIAAGWLSRLEGFSPLLVGMPWSAYALGYLLVTYVWTISERILLHARADLVGEGNALRWPRMLGRAAVLSLLLFGLGSPGVAALAGGIVLPAFFPRCRYRWWAILTDIAISMLVFALVRGALM